MLALSGHLLAGGAEPRLWWLLAMLIASMSAGVALSRHRWSLWSLLPFLLLAQLLFHLLFEWAAASGLDAFVGTATGSGMGHMTGGAAWTMVATHLGAALVTAWALRYGEASWWVLLEHVCWHVRRVVTTFTLPCVVDIAAFRLRADSLPVSRECSRGVHSRRGPPSASLV